jgi:hypothetical protein
MARFKPNDHILIEFYDKDLVLAKVLVIHGEYYRLHTSKLDVLDKELIGDYFISYIDNHSELLTNIELAKALYL